MSATKNKKIDPKIGEIIKLNGKRYMCEKDEPNTIGCFDCDLDERDCQDVECGRKRSDGNFVHFIELKDC